MHVENHFNHNWLIKKLVNDKVRANLGGLRGVIIDLGCGTRPYERDILDYADCYIGVDWNKTLHGVQADVAADLAKPLPFQSASADSVVAFEVLEHVAEPDMMLSEANQILREGGTLMLSIPFQWWVHEAPWDYQRFTRYGLDYQLNKAGFVDIEIQPTSGFWAMWILKFNYQLARLIRGPRPLRWIIRAVLIPFWWSGQMFAPIMDRFWPCEEETAGYFVTARKGVK